MVDFFLFANHTNVSIFYLFLVIVDETDHCLDANCSDFNCRKWFDLGIRYLNSFYVLIKLLSARFFEFVSWYEWSEWDDLIIMSEST